MGPLDAPGPTTLSVAPSDAGPVCTSRAMVKVTGDSLQLRGRVPHDPPPSAKRARVVALASQRADSVASLLIAALRGLGTLSGLTSPKPSASESRALLLLVLDSVERLADCPQALTALQMALLGAQSRLRARGLAPSLCDSHATSDDKQSMLKSAGGDSVDSLLDIEPLPSEDTVSGSGVASESKDPADEVSEKFSCEDAAPEEDNFSTPECKRNARKAETVTKFPFGGPVPVEEDLEAWLDRSLSHLKPDAK